MKRLVEGELIFDFSTAKRAEKLDTPGEQIPVGMSFVDFVVDRGRDVLLIEVKDPSHSEATEKAREEFIKTLRGKELLNALVPKCRDSYTYLHLMKEDTKPFLYIVLIAIENTSVDVSLLLPLKDKLLSRLRHEAREPWKREYVRDCQILDVQTWNRQLPFPVLRDS